MTTAYLSSTNAPLRPLASRYKYKSAGKPGFRRGKRLGRREELICGRYEGVDERINELYCDLELSIGDYVLSGGELAAAVVVDATMRLLPGVLETRLRGSLRASA